MVRIDFPSLSHALESAFCRSFSEASDLAPTSMKSSWNESRVPEVGGGPSTSIFTFGSDLSISDQFLFGFGISLPSAPGTCSARARNTCASVSLSGVPAFDCARTRPSMPTLISTMSVTPFFLQSSNSPFFMAREAFVMSGWPTPTPAQNNFMPPPVPVDSTIGVLLPARPNCSATAVVNG